MSPAPHAPAPPRLDTKNSLFPGSGSGQKSAAAEFTGAGRWTAGCHGASIEARFATQMSLGSVSPPTAPGRVEARYRLSPSNDSIGQPSACALLRADSSTAVPHSPNARALVTAGAATSATREAA